MGAVAGAEGGQSAAKWRDTRGAAIKYPGLGGWWSLAGAVLAASAAVRRVATQGYQALA